MGYHERLTAALRGALAPQRPALILSLVAGVQVMRQMMGLSALAEAKPAALVEILAPIFQQLVDGERPGRTRTRAGRRSRGRRAAT